MSLNNNKVYCEYTDGAIQEQTKRQEIPQQAEMLSANQYMNCHFI